MINLNNVESESSLAYIEVPEVDEPQSAGGALQRQTEEGCWAECGVLRAVRLQELVDDHEGLTDPLYDLVHLGVVLPALPAIPPQDCSTESAKAMMYRLGNEKCGKTGGRHMACAVVKMKIRH